MEDKEKISHISMMLKKGDLTYFNDFYQLTKKSIYFTISSIFKDRMIQEDLMQETYLTFLDNIKKIDESQEVLAYLVKIAKNKALNLLKIKRRETLFYLSEEEFGLYTFNIDRNSMLSTIKDVLNEKEYLVFVLKVLGEYSFKEISKISNIPIGTCTWLYQEARKKLKEVF